MAVTPPTPNATLVDRARGALLGGALGDALGMPTQTLSPTAIVERYGRIDGFVAPVPDHSVSRGLVAGHVTDDTEQTLLLAEALLEGDGALDQRRWVESLDAWERDIVARGGGDLLGPSTRRAIEAVRRGEPPERSGASGDTNGAAMRIAPVGILVAPAPLERLLERVVDTALATHHTGAAIAGAAAVAAAVSSGIDGADWRAASARAVVAARAGADLGHRVDGADCAARIERALALVARRDAAEPPARAAATLAATLGTGVATRESVPCAFALLALADGDPWRAGLLAANVGGDTDTIGAIAAGIGGACVGAAALPAWALEALRGLERGRLERLADALVARRVETGGR